MYFNREEPPSGSVNKPLLLFLLLLLLLLLLIVSLFSVNTYVWSFVMFSSVSTTCKLTSSVSAPQFSCPSLARKTVQIRFNNFRSFLFDDQGLHSFLSFSVKVLANNLGKQTGQNCYHSFRKRLNTEIELHCQVKDKEQKTCNKDDLENH